MHIHDVSYCRCHQNGSLCYTAFWCSAQQHSEMAWCSILLLNFNPSLSSDVFSPISGPIFFRLFCIRLVSTFVWGSFPLHFAIHYWLIHFLHQHFPFLLRFPCCVWIAFIFIFIFFCRSAGIGANYMSALDESTSLTLFVGCFSKIFLVIVGGTTGMLPPLGFISLALYCHSDNGRNSLIWCFKELVKHHMKLWRNG